MEYLPESVNSYINKTWEEGRDVAYDLYDDIKEEVLSKSDAHVDALTDMMEKFFERANEIHSSIKTVREYLFFFTKASNEGAGRPVQGSPLATRFSHSCSCLPPTRHLN